MKIFSIIMTVAVAGVTMFFTQVSAQAEHSNYHHERHHGVKYKTDVRPYDPYHKIKRIKHGPRYHYHNNYVCEKKEEVVIPLSSDVLFDFGSADLKPQASSALANAADQIRRDATGPVYVEGHTDSVGSARSNMKLSVRRAEAVKHWLYTHGNVDNVNLVVTGYGESRPVAPNSFSSGKDNPLGRAQNRRVDLRMTTLE